MKHLLTNNIMNKENIKCPNCNSEKGLFRCSLGKLNCSDCMQHIQEQDPVAVNLAYKFHRYYEELAPEFGYETKEDTKEFDAQSKNGKLMVAVCERILANLVH